MITVSIGQAERPAEEATPDWINQQINRRRADEMAVCVRVRINKPGANVVLTTPTCSGVGGGGRAPNSLERRILELWEDRGLRANHFTGGNLVAFLRQLAKLLC